MTAYYNEYEKSKAAWLRHLIEEGAIAHGVVDERPIQAVEPADLRGFAQCHFFAGIGLWSLCARRAGWPDDRPIWTGSCPCGPFSVAGKGEGFADPRHLWPEWFRLVCQCRPSVLFGEQSDAAIDWLDLVSADLEGLRYAFGPVDLPAAGFGGAHKRQRFGFVADTDNTQWWSERSPWHDGIWPKTGWVQGHRDIGDGGKSGRLANADQHGRQPGNGRRPLCAAHDLEHGCQPGELGNACGDGPAPIGGNDGEVRRFQEAQRQSEHGAAIPRRPSQVGGVVDSAGSGCRVGSGGVSYLYRPDGSRPVDWLLCRDSRWRPVESGTCPLVDESPALMGRLRGYGDAIDVEAFTNFIGAYLDCAPDFATSSQAPA